MIKKYFAAILTAFVVFGACKKDSSLGPMLGKDDGSFTAYENNFLTGFWKLDPDLATRAGYHKYDSLLMVPSDQNRGKLLDYVKVQMDSISRFEVGTLSAANKIDYHIMENELESIEWRIQQLRDYEWNPATYNIIGTFAYILNGHYAPLAKRLRNFSERMANVQAYYKEAEKQIKNPVPDLAQLAIAQLDGGLNVFGKDLDDSLKRSGIPAPEQQQITERAKTTTETIKAFTEWLKNLKNDHPKSFRLGKDPYADKFKYLLQVESPPQHLYNAAEERKDNIQHQMLAISGKLWPKYFGTKPMPADSLDMIARLVDTISAKHSQADQLQSVISGILPKLAAFIKSKDLLTLDLSRPLIVRKEPGYMAGLADASMSAPGTNDKDGYFYFNLANTNEWPADQVESYLREYNDYTLQLLCMQEAFPGHYVQQVYAAKAISPIKSIFGNKAMVEGWAVYSEEMMIDAGYDANEPEMTLMWYKSQLRSVYNTILDYDVHCENMSRQDALKLLTKEAFQQQAEADENWTRATETSVQMDAGFAGYQEIIDLREAYKKKMGDKYTLKDFNEKLLGYGSAPVMYTKEAMLAKEVIQPN